jgi:signal transduction histidine kinase
VDALICRVLDSGPGVSTVHAERIFDPFFTTKPPGEGTGLGLANARRLAEEMEGAVELEPGPSALGGACFRFVLPALAESTAGRGVREGDAAQSRMS